MSCQNYYIKKFEDTLGQECDFFGVDNNVFCLGFVNGPKRAFEAMEDENDGLRSMMEEIKEVAIEGHIFFQQPVARVCVEKAESGTRDGFYGYQLVDKETHHVWLRFGTVHNDCYPCFVFKYLPDLSKVQTNE